MTTQKALLLTTVELMEVLHCCRRIATETGDLANARIMIGKRTFWNKAKIEKYIDEKSH